MISTLKVVRSKIIKLGRLIEKMLSVEGKRTDQLIYHWKPILFNDSQIMGQKLTVNQGLCTYQ